MVIKVAFYGNNVFCFKGAFTFWIVRCTAKKFVAFIWDTFTPNFTAYCVKTTVVFCFIKIRMPARDARVANKNFVEWLKCFVHLLLPFPRLIYVVQSIA